MTVKLQYVVHNRLDIALAVVIIARLSENPKENHMITVKWYWDIWKVQKTMDYIKREVIDLN